MPHVVGDDSLSKPLAVGAVVACPEMKLCASAHHRSKHVLRLPCSSPLSKLSELGSPLPCPFLFFRATQGLGFLGASGGTDFVHGIAIKMLSPEGSLFAPEFISSTLQSSLLLMAMVGFSYLKLGRVEDAEGALRKLRLMGNLTGPASEIIEQKNQVPFPPKPDDVALSL
jgi:hypothetical protein